MLPLFIQHYRKSFPGCRIVVYDNMSTDSSQTIAKAYGCEVIAYDTGGKLDDLTYLKIKNNCWDDAKTDWVLVADVDEWCDFTKYDLKQADLDGHTVLRFEAYNMVNMEDNLDVLSIEMGERAPSYDKMYCFNRKKIKAVNYSPGCHSASPEGIVSTTSDVFICRHYKYINIDYMVERHAIFASRLSDENKKRGYGFHYLYPKEKIYNEFQQARLNAKIL